MSLAACLQQGVEALGLALSPSCQGRLLAYQALIAKWNRTYNLTAIRDEREMVVQHLLDSLSVLPHLPSTARVADIGSGAGLPGIPLAIADPELQVTLVETVDKKSAFQRQAKIELGLANLTVTNARVEQLPAGGFDAVISRAFAEIVDFVNLAGHLLAPGGRMYAMKGVLPEAEMARLPAGWRVGAVTPLQVPGLAAQRHLIVIERV